MPFNNLILRIIILLSIPVLSGCSALGVGATVGAATGIAAAKEGGIPQSLTDLHIEAQINDLWFKYSVEAFSKLNLTVEQGRVLVTGVVQNPDQRVEAIRLAWQPEGVVQVINEVHIADSEGFQGFVRDTWISTQLRTKMTFNRDVQSVNYTIDTVSGVVYLMGVAQTREELNKVIELARTTSYVKQVISYIKMAGEQLENTSDYEVTTTSEL